MNFEPFGTDAKSNADKQKRQTHGTALLCRCGPQSALACTSMCCKPVAVVVGATGKQGTGVVKALLAAGKFDVKAITRDPHSVASSHLSI